MRNGKSKSGSKYPKSGKGSRKFNAKDEKSINTNERDSSYSRGSRGNDPAWYNKFPELVSVATNVSWNVAYGSEIRANTDNALNAEVQPGYVTWSPGREVGIARIGFIPTFGVGDKLTDPINKCALEMYSQLRFNKSGSPGYDPADVMQVMQAMDSVYMYIALSKRLYGAMNIASSVNRYIPRTLVSALGFDYADILAHKADLLFHINNIIVQSAKINVPLGMTVIARHDFLCSNVFTDEALSRNTMFLYDPDVLWKYDEINARLEAINLSDYHTFEAWVELGYDLLNAVERVEDFYTLNANILSAYDYSGLFRLVGIEGTYSTIPVHRTEMLIQFHNTTFVGNVFNNNEDVSTLYVTQNVTEGDPNLGALEFTPWCEGTPTGAYDQILDIPFENPSTDDIMEASRCKVATVIMSNDELNLSRAYQQIVSCGTEICTTCDVYTYFKRWDSTWQVAKSSLFNEYGAVGSPAYSRWATKINMAPVAYEFAQSEYTYTPSGGLSPVTIQVIYPWFVYGDLTNYAMVNGDNLANMHLAALLSQLAVTRSNLG